MVIKKGETYQVKHNNDIVEIVLYEKVESLLIPKEEWNYRCKIIGSSDKNRVGKVTIYAEKHLEEIKNKKVRNYN